MSYLSTSTQGRNKINLRQYLPSNHHLTAILTKFFLINYLVAINWKILHLNSIWDIRVSFEIIVTKIFFYCCTSYYWFEKGRGLEKNEDGVVQGLYQPIFVQILNKTYNIFNKFTWKSPSHPRICHCCFDQTVNYMHLFKKMS